ncbi:hypothetical protein ABT288_34075 [Streptomyces sp. NPDC001093]|uniref:hypothetical protein n=1 Tax=Streptomyces sp. NPDC001093 TaxID=3154376 RepID=UPI003316E112
MASSALGAAARGPTGDGPLDGLLLDITGFTREEAGTGVALATELGQLDAGSRAIYDPRLGDAEHFDWTGAIR